MGRKILFAGLAVLFGGAIFAVLLYLPGGSTPPRRPLESPVQDPDARTAVHLYFSDRANEYLLAEKRGLERTGDPVSDAVAVIEALIAGPEGDLVPTLPPQTRLRTLFLVEGGRAVVDFTEAIRAHHPGGSRTELLTVYSVINSLVLNISEIETVQILVDGKEADTLAGHIDLRYPFKADMLMVR